MDALELGRRLRQLAALALLAGLFVGALAIARGARLDEADFVFNNGTEVSTLDPATVTGVPEGRVIRAIFEGLVIKHPRTLEPLPGMAESWELSDDGLVYTFHIRRGARWSSGEPISAEDFMYSFERFLDPETAAEYAYQLWYVKGAKAFTTEVDDRGQALHDFSTVGITMPDEYTLRMELKSPTPFFMDLMAFYPLFPVNRANIEEAQRLHPSTWRHEWLRPANIVTNGPYKVAFRRVNDRIRLVKNHDYWDADNVAFESIDVLAIEQDSTMLNMYLTGGANYIDRVSTNVVPIMMKREDFNPAPYLGTYFYRVNCTQPPFDDARVRKALYLTIPRQVICDKIMKMGQVPAQGLVPPGMPGGYPGARAPEGDAETARRLLAEAGFGPGGKPFPTIEIHYNTSEAHQQIAIVIADSWQKTLGIRAKLLNQEWKVYLDTQQNLDFDVSRSAWIGDYADPNTFLDMFVTGGENNKTGWGDPQYDRLISEAARELDPVRRTGILMAAEQVLVDQLPILPIYFYVTQNVVNPRLGGFYENIQDEHFPKFWYWMDDAELAAVREQLPPSVVLVDPHGPPEGLYSPAQLRARRSR